MCRNLYLVVAAIAAGFLSVLAKPLAAERVWKPNLANGKLSPIKACTNSSPKTSDEVGRLSNSVLGPQTDAPDVDLLQQWVEPGAISLAKLTASSRCFGLIAGCPVCGHLLSG